MYPNSHFIPSIQEKEDFVDCETTKLGAEKKGYGGYDDGQKGALQREEEREYPDIPRSMVGLLQCPQSLVSAYMMALAQQATGINAGM